MKVKRSRVELNDEDSNEDKNMSSQVYGSNEIDIRDFLVKIIITFEQDGGDLKKLQKSIVKANVGVYSRSLRGWIANFKTKGTSVKNIANCTESLLGDVQKRVLIGSVISDIHNHEVVRHRTMVNRCEQFFGTRPT